MENGEVIEPNITNSESKFALFEIKADKQPIGKFALAKKFSTSTVNLKEGDQVYLFSDGYADQFGGEKGKKLKSKKL